MSVEESQLERRKRRNGLPLSCEPCRKSKVRCDHQGPRCSRCIKRRLACVYDATPTTRRQYTPDRYSIGGSEEPVRYNQSKDHSAFRDSPSILQLPAPNQARSIAPGLGQSPSTSVQHHAGLESLGTAALFHKQGTSYGPTRYSAVFSENQDSFASAIQAVVNPALDPPVSSPNEIISTTGDSLRELAIDTLLHFPTLRTVETLLLDIEFMHDIWISPFMIRRCLSQVWTQYGEHLGSNRSRESVWAMAQDLHDNGKLNASVTESKCGNWFSGTTLRWEMIGILFAWAGMAFKYKQERDHVFTLPEQQNRNRRTSADKMRECSVACLKFRASEISDISVVLMKNSVRLQAMIFSDESDQLRADFGTVGSAFVIAGLHRLPRSDKITPLSQYRSCISASMYSVDKRDSLFHGRPPMLNRPYCHCPLPLDLSEEDLYSGPERLNSAVSRLSPEGWNTDGKIHTTTWLRADCMLSPIREDILLLSLSFDKHFTQADVEALIFRLDDVVKSYPPQLQYSYKAQWVQETASGASAEDTFIVARIQLDVLQCSFLLQRLSVSKGGDGQRLFDIAEEIMAVILCIWSNRDHIQNYCYTFDWIIVCFGIPAAGILCIELLKANAAASTTTPISQQPHSRIRLSRSKVVQSLVMFVAYLDWIRPTDNNAQLCWRFRDVLRRIIDTAFDPPRAMNVGQEQNQGAILQVPPAAQHEQIEQPAVLSGTDFLQGISPSWMSTDDLDWLATVDWTQGEWLDFSR